ncbi:hypothetical protein ABMA28_001686 [Loxostege sticticalis]|uniref:Reverse transcriptase domain-containing protein n=1 Tax=Loxostege sticticalis TaxID=481309 RepID=A0ABD0T2K9_LOXSC
MAINIKEFVNCNDINYYFQQLPPKRHALITSLHFNIRSLIKNFTKLQQVIHSSKYPLDLIILTEVGVTDMIVNLFNIPGYNMYYQLRSTQRGGGIIVYVKNHLKFTITPYKSIMFENLTGILKLSPNVDVVVCAIYKPPKRNKYLFVKELGRYVSNYDAKTNLLLIGDSNIDLKTISSQRDTYLQTLSERGLMCGISNYTRIETRKNKVTKSCIDHIFARFPTFDPFSAVLDVALADHRGIVFTCLDDSPPTRRVQGVTQKTTFDRTIFSNEVSAINWELTNNMSSSNDILSFIKKSFLAAIKTATVTRPVRDSKSRRNLPVAPWINGNVTRLCEKRDYLFKLWKNSSFDPKIRLEYNKTRNKLHKLIELKRNTYYLNEINNNFKDTKKVYKIINQMLGRVTLSIDEAILKAFDGQGLTTKDIADNFANGFEKAVKDIVPRCSLKLTNSLTYRRPVDSSILFQKVSQDKVNQVIKRLNSNKAPGPDGIRVADLKVVDKHISLPIANLINRSIVSGEYPDDLKIGCVRPVFKKGKHDVYSNYRPITLLSSVDKIVEKVVCEQIHNFYRKHDVINKNQFGFQAGKSTTDLLSKFTDEVNEHLNHRKCVLALFIDFSRAFDTLQHQLLINKLDDCGIRGSLLNWCRNYLQNRTFTVKLDNSFSDPKCVTEDDTCLLVSGRDVSNACNSLQADLDMLIRWCHDVGLVLNADKTKLMVINSPYMRYPTPKPLIAHNHDCLHQLGTCQCPTIEVVTTQKYLGLIIDSKFNWGHHIEHVCNKLRQFLANIKILKNRIPFKVRLMLYNSLAESYIQYGLTSYGRTFKSYLQQIYDLQFRILKNIISPNMRVQLDDENAIFKHCKILPVYDQIKFMILKQYFFCDHIKSYIEHPVRTRAMTQNRLRVITANNVYGQRTAAYQVPRLINELPSDVRDKITQQNIKTKLKRFFLS